MFPLTHLHVLSRIHPLDHQAVLGSVFPDTCIASSLTWRETHRCGLDFFRFLAPSQRSEFSPFVVGLLSHGIEPHGLDFYADECYKDFGCGYSFHKAPPLVREAIEVCLIEEKMGPWKAHNFIEMGVEILVAESRGDLFEHLLSALEDNELVVRLSAPLGSFFGRPKREMEDSFNLFRPLLSSNIETLAEKYVMQLGVKHGIHGINQRRVSDLIARAMELVAEDYGAFLLDCTTRIGMDLLSWMKEL